MHVISVEALCIYCGASRPSVARSVPCRGCGRDAEGVRSWRATEQRAVFRSGDGAHVGELTLHHGRLGSAWGARIEGHDLAVPSYASAIDSTGLRAAGASQLGPAVQLALRRDARAHDLAATLTPLAVAAALGMAARGSCALRELRGWRRHAGKEATPAAWLAVAPGAAPRESLAVERALLAGIERACDALARAHTPPVDEGAREAHYRTSAAPVAARWCFIEDALACADALGLAERFDETPSNTERASESALAFRAFAASHPTAVRMMIEARTRDG